MADVLKLILGLIVLSVAADRFVLGAARLSTALRMSPILIGALVIGFGTSLPEIVVSALAAARGSADLAYGNIVGSNIANVLLVLGAAALIRPLAVGLRTLRREAPLMLGGVSLMALAGVNGRMGTVEGVILLTAGAAAVAFIAWSGKRDREAAAVLAAEVAEYGGKGPPVAWRAGLLAVAGLIGTLAGAQVFLDGAVGLARALGVSEAAIGLTIVAVGTSLPELVTAVAAARRDEPDLIVGNVLGSNLFNALIVAGLLGVMDTVYLRAEFAVSIMMMLGSCALAALLLGTGRRLDRWEAGVMLALFAGFVFVAL